MGIGGSIAFWRLCSRFNFCSGSTANAPANRQMPIASVVMANSRKMKTDSLPVVYNYKNCLKQTTVMRKYLLIIFIGLFVFNVNGQSTFTAIDTKLKLIKSHKLNELICTSSSTAGKFQLYIA